MTARFLRRPARALEREPQTPSLVHLVHQTFGTLKNSSIELEQSPEHVFPFNYAFYAHAMVSLCLSLVNVDTVNIYTDVERLVRA